MSDGTTYKVIVSKHAAVNQFQHIEFLARVSIPAANRLTDDFERAYLSLEKNPKRCPVFNTKHTKKSYHRLVVGRYQVIFSIDEKESVVYVQYILDSRQDNDI